MADEELSGERPDRPVLAGLLALLGVGLVVGLVLGAVALAGVKVLGLGGGGSDDAEAGAAESFYLPKPQRTDPPDGPLITLAADPEASRRAGQPEPSEPTASAEPEEAITLSAGQTQVAPMQQIDLTGVYPGGEGAIVQVQRLADGQWVDFPVTASVSNRTFTTYVQTGQTGMNRFRVVDTGTGLASNEVRVRIG